MNKNKKNKNKQQFQQQGKQQQQQQKHPGQQPQELSYYRLLLLSFLKESHPELAGDSDFIAARADSAAEEYSESVRSGSTHDAAAEAANQVLFAGLMGVSPKTVEAWEAGRNMPDGPARRILSMLKTDPGLPQRFNIIAK